MRGGCSRLGIHNLSVCVCVHIHVYISIVSTSTHSNSWQHFEPRFTNKHSYVYSYGAYFQNRSKIEVVSTCSCSRNTTRSNSTSRHRFCVNLSSPEPQESIILKNLPQTQSAPSFFCISEGVNRIFQRLPNISPSQLVWGSKPRGSSRHRIRVPNRVPLAKG